MRLHLHSASLLAALALASTLSCSAPCPEPAALPTEAVASFDPAPPNTTASPPDVVRAAIGRVLDDWHLAAANADEECYFGHMSDDAVFLGTDATERWDKAAFQRYAHPHFAKGKAWSFRAVRRAIVLADDGHLAWFDEDLATPNLGPARGSGVLRQTPQGTWQIAHYNLTITVPNEIFKSVKALIEGQPAPVREAPLP